MPINVLLAIDHPAIHSGAGGIISTLAVLGLLTGLVVTWR